MIRKLELLAPGGDIDSIKAAIAAGADAIYCGLNKFHARRSASKLKFEGLGGILRLAHSHNCKVFLTLNIVILEREIPDVIDLLNQLARTSIDGVILQDFGLFYLLSHYFKELKIHASTQVTTHNAGQIEFLSQLATTRVNLSRELKLEEIRALSAVAQKNNMLTEIFVHGSYCISYSGICYISSVHGAGSGNRGMCAQPCRAKYETTQQGRSFPLNLKDNSAYFDLKEIAEADVSSLKIEGRTKKSDYTFTVVRCWRRQLQSFYEKGELNPDNSDLYKVFNRDFSNGYLRGDIDKNMFIDNPRDHSIKRLAEIHPEASPEKREKDESDLYDEKEAITADVARRIQLLDAKKSPLQVSVSGRAGHPLRISIQTPDASFSVVSAVPLAPAGQSAPSDGGPHSIQCGRGYLHYDSLLKRLGSLNSTEYHMEHLDLEHLQADLFLPFKEFTAMKKRLLFLLNGSQNPGTQAKVPPLKRQNGSVTKPSLAVLISSPADLPLCRQSAATTTFYYQLPASLAAESANLVALFSKNKFLRPWFPSVLIGEDYAAAVGFLHEVQPELIVTNNTGVAYAAAQKKIPWIGGPHLNLTNSFSLLCLKEKFDCRGAFLSNELSKNQLKSITRPDDFDLYTSIYHPILLLSSRQCLLQPVAGCAKHSVDDACLPSCNRSSTITNQNNVTLFVHKEKGNYACVYHEINALNTDIVTDLPGFFSAYFVDLRDIATATSLALDKAGIIRLFEQLIDEKAHAEKDLKQAIYPTTNNPYCKGI